jgi:VWFA-related protein
MKAKMRVLSFILFVAGSALLLPAVNAQNPGEELPSAPSATLQQKKPQAPPPKPPQEAPAPPQQTSPPPSQPDPQTQVPANAPQPQPTASAPPPPTDAPRVESSKTDAPSPADKPATPAEEPATTIRAFVNEVNVVFTVTDKHGRYVRDLKKADFKVLDDSRPANEIRSFHSESDLPLQVGLLVDASNSVRDRFKFEQEAAIEFLNQTVRPKSDEAFVVGFDSTPDLTQDFTNDTEALSRGVRDLRPGGGTAMYDALYYACRDKLLKRTRSGPVRRAIILLSDGDDNQSHVTREEAIEMAQRAEVIVYSISTNVTGSANRGDKILQRISDATGGRAFFPFQITDVADAFSEIQDELRSQYALSYRPATLSTDGRFHTIEILALNHKNLKVRARRGYYAPSR